MGGTPAADSGERLFARLEVAGECQSSAVMLHGVRPGVCRTRRVGIFHGVTDIDDFLAGLEPAERGLFRHICELVVGVVPEAQPGKSYGMTAYRAAGKPLLGFTSNKAHLAMHPFSPAVVEAVTDDLTGFSLSKGTIRFSTDRPVPDEVVERIVRLRMAEIRP